MIIDSGHSDKKMLMILVVFWYGNTNTCASSVSELEWATHVVITFISLKEGTASRCHSTKMHTCFLFSIKTFWEEAMINDIWSVPPNYNSCRIASIGVRGMEYHITGCYLNDYMCAKVSGHSKNSIKRSRTDLMRWDF